MSLYREPFHLKSSRVKPPAVELATAFWYEMVILIHTIFCILFAAVFSSLFFQTSSDLSLLWISSSLGDRQPLSSSYITSQNRWWDYPTAWWNHQTPWKNYRITSLSCTTLRRKLVKSGLKSQVFSEVAYSQDRRWFRQQDARHTENKAGRDGLSVGTISHFLAGRYPSSRFWIFNFDISW